MAMYHHTSLNFLWLSKWFRFTKMRCLPITRAGGDYQDLYIIFMYKYCNSVQSGKLRWAHLYIVDNYIMWCAGLPVACN